MPHLIKAHDHADIRLWAELEEIESDALEQIKNVARLPIIHGHIAVMPDVHYGIGATVGTVIASRYAVIPAAVGVDIGCGMCAFQTNLKAEDLPDSLAPLRKAIEKRIPVGMNSHRNYEFGGTTYEKKIEKHLRDVERVCEGRFGGKEGGKSGKQIGTLGGGNHFIELCLDGDKQVWLMLHSGSRNIGNEIAKIHIGKAKKLSKKKGIDLPDHDLAWFEDGTPEFESYVEDVFWAQEYARYNREVMAELIFKTLRDKFFPQLAIQGKVVNCHHNYIARETYNNEELLVTRKGAVRAGTEDWAIIPGSMGARSFIVTGKGNPESFSSCSHGAGRAMSRNKARKVFSKEDLVRATEGVECRKDLGVLDEIPGAYKNIDQVIQQQSDLIEVRYTLKQILCVKG
jgi:tRNA-splicing ligase RtcB